MDKKLSTPEDSIGIVDERQTERSLASSTVGWNFLWMYNDKLRPSVILPTPGIYVKIRLKDSGKEVIGVVAKVTRPLEDGQELILHPIILVDAEDMSDPEIVYSLQQVKAWMEVSKEEYVAF